MIEPNSLCQIDLLSNDPSLSRQFLSEVFKWNTLPMPLSGSYIIKSPKDTIYGIRLSKIESRTIPPEAGSILYFKSEISLLSMIEKIQEHGGRIVEGPNHLPSYGTNLTLEAPGGLYIGLFFPE